MFGQLPGKVSTDAEERRQNYENSVEKLTRILDRPHRQPHQPLTNQLNDIQTVISLIIIYSYLKHWTRLGVGLNTNRINYS